MRNGYGVDAFGSDPSHVVDREAERHSCAILSRQGKGGAIRDRPRISGKPVTRKAVGEGEGKMKIESREQFLNSRHTHERQFLCHDHFSSCVQSAVETARSRSTGEIDG